MQSEVADAIEPVLTGVEILTICLAAVAVATTIVTLTRVHAVERALRDAVLALGSVRSEVLKAAAAMQMQPVTAAPSPPSVATGAGASPQAKSLAPFHMQQAPRRVVAVTHDDDPIHTRTTLRAPPTEQDLFDLRDTPNVALPALPLSRTPSPVPAGPPEEETTRAAPLKRRHATMTGVGVPGAAGEAGASALASAPEPERPTWWVGNGEAGAPSDGVPPAPDVAGSLAKPRS